MMVRNSSILKLTKNIYFSWAFFSIECPILPTIPNGLVIQTGTTTGDVATYTCNQGFELNGPPTRVCMSDSTWSGQAPECQSLDGEGITYGQT